MWKILVWCLIAIVVLWIYVGIKEPGYFDWKGFFHDLINGRLEI